MTTKSNLQSLYENSIKILSNLISFKTISGEDNNQLIKNGVSGYINPVSDFESMSSGIQKLIKNNDVRFQMGIESNRILRENFSLKKFKEEYLRLLQKQ